MQIQILKNQTNFHPYLFFNTNIVIIISMFFINSRSILKFGYSKKQVTQLLFTQKLRLSFSIWKKPKLVQSSILTQNQKPFLKDIIMKESKIQDQKNQIDIESTEQIKHSSFLKSKKKTQNGQKKVNIKVKMPLRNPQQFLFKSKFHQNGLGIDHYIKEIQRLNDKFVKQNEKQQFKAALAQICKQRQKILKQNMTKQQIHEQFLKFSNKSEENLKIKNYFFAYNKICQMVQKILNNLQKQGHSFNQIHYTMLNLISYFSLQEFYKYYLFKLLHIRDLHNLDTITFQQAKLCWFIVQKLPQIEFQFANDTMNFALQKYVQQFFDKKLQIIIEKVKNQLKIANKQFESEDSFQVLEKQISFLTNVQKIFKTTHLTFGKHNFYSKFIRKNISHVQKFQKIDEKNLKERTQKIVELFHLSIQNLFLDKQIIKKFEKYLEKTSEKFDSNLYLSGHVSKLLIEIYKKIGSIPDLIYDNFVIQQIYDRFSKDEYNLVQSIKFYVYSQCDDKLLLQSFLKKLQNLVCSSQFSLSKKSKHLLHFLFHLLCIKYPKISVNNVSKRILGYCTTHTPKDHFILGQIMKQFKKPTKIRNKNIYQTKFASFCIQKQSKNIENNIKSQLSKLQQKIFKVCLQNVIKKLNADPNQLFYYQMKQQFSFCSFQMDYVVLKWDSQKRQKLFGYLDAECVGLQYSYDKYESENDQQTIKKMQKMSLVQYEKGLQLIRKKKVRQQILKHYGWKILYVPNKFLYKKNMSWQRFQQKLSQAILAKFALKQ